MTRDELRQTCGRILSRVSLEENAGLNAGDDLADLLIECGAKVDQPRDMTQGQIIVEGLADRPELIAEAIDCRLDAARRKERYRAAEVCDRLAKGNQSLRLAYEHVAQEIRKG